jgi:hypothetical protein
VACRRRLGRRGGVDAPRPRRDRRRFAILISPPADDQY